MLPFAAALTALTPLVMACAREEAPMASGHAVASREIAVGDDETDASTFAWSPDGARVAVLARLVRKVSLYDVQSGTRLSVLDDLAGGASSVAFLADGRVVAAPRGVPGTAASVWRPETGEVAQLPSPGGDPGDTATNMLLSFGVDPGSQRLLGIHKVRAGQGYAMRLALYDAASLTLVTAGGGSASKVAMAPGGQQAALVGQDGQVAVIDIASGRQVAHINAHINPVQHLAWSADGKRLATGTMPQGYGKDRRTGQLGPLHDTELLKLWDVATGDLLAVAGTVSGGVVSIDFSRDGKWLAVADGDGNVRLLDARSLRESALLASEGRPAGQEVRFSPDSQCLGRLRQAERRLALHRVAGAGS